MESFILSLELQSNLLFLKIIFFGLTLFLIGFLIFFLLRARWLKFIFIYPFAEFLSKNIFGARKAKRQWKKILKKRGNFQEKDYKKSIIKVDKLLDRILAEIVPFFQDTTFEERVSKLGYATLSNLDEIREAHKICNKIREDSNYELSIEEGKNVLSIYEQSFRDLGVV